MRAATQGKATARVPWQSLLAVALAALTLAAFGRACQNGFVNFDDHTYVTENPNVRDGLSWGRAVWAWKTEDCFNWHPLTWLSLQADYDLYGRGRPWDKRLAWGYHLTSVLLHAVNVVLLFVVLRGMTGCVARSAVVAALFAVHPLHVESVAWVSERKDVLCGFFGILTLGAYAWYARRPGLSRYLWVTVAFALGLMAKPMLVTLPCVLLLLDYWPLGRLTPGQDKATPGRWSWAGAGRLLLEKLPWLALSAYGSVRTWQAQQHGEAIQSLNDIPLAARFGNAVLSYGVYLAKTLWPVNLAVFYPHPGAGLSWGLVALSAAVLVAVSIAAWRLAPRFPYVAVGWLWYLGMLVPVIGVTQAGEQAYADRFTYWPHIGLFILVVWGAADLATRWRVRRMAVGLAAVVVAVLAARTWSQVGYWHDSLTLWRHAVAVTRNNPVAHLQLASTLEHAGRPDQTDEAVSHCRRAVELTPDNASAHCQLGMLLLKQGQSAEGTDQLEEAVRLDPGLTVAHAVLLSLLEARGRLDEAIDHGRKAVAAYAGDAALWYTLGHALSRKGRWPEAADAYAQAVRLGPRDWRARCSLAHALYQQGRRDDAREQYRRSLALDPTWPADVNRQLRQLAQQQTGPDRSPDRMVEMAEQLCQATDESDPEYLDTLAMAYACAGRFDRACTTAKKALKLATAPGQREAIGDRLKRYQGGQASAVRSGTSQ